MRRRQFIQLVQGSLLGAVSVVGTAIAADKKTPPAKSTANTLSLEWLGHMSFLVSGEGKQVLTHPFKPAGCTAKFPAPKAKSDLILISSRLLDEGWLEDLSQDTQLLYQAGAYKVAGLNIQGINMEHDRVGGRRFGANVAWGWQQAGIRILHLGGAASPIKPDQRILMGRPDVLILPVGGGPKGYDAKEAKEAIDMLNPKLVIPTHYLTSKAATTCELSKLDEFLAIMAGTKINNITGSKLQINSASLSETMTVAVFKS